jgi:hypothetical protein
MFQFKAIEGRILVIKDLFHVLIRTVGLMKPSSINLGNFLVVDSKGWDRHGHRGF